MRLPDFLEVVKKAVLIKAKDGVDRQNINSVIIVAFDQLDDQTKVNLILSSLNDKDIDDIINQEKKSDNEKELDGLNHVELIRLKSWIIKGLITFAGILGVSFSILMFFTGESCDPNSSVGYLVEIKKFIDIIIFNKTD